MKRKLPTAKSFEKQVASCTSCPRLVAWREEVADKKTRRFIDDTYWGRPVPSFGAADAELVIVGLAPAAHGANRTGRMFTGDRSGDWLYEALYTYGFASQPTSETSDDGLRLINTRITAVAHCAPPQNKLTTDEIRACRGFLETEMLMCTQGRVYIALGGIAYRELVRALPWERTLLAPKFGHGAELELPGDRLLLASYHPSQQNTFTGRLTRDMFHDIFRKASMKLRKNS